VRRNAGLSGPQLAARLGFDQSKISRIENGKLWPPPSDFVAWLDACGVAAAERDRIMALVSGVELGITAYRELVRGALVNRQSELIDMDASARSLRQFCPLVVSGLLHTADYARACLAAANFGGLPDVDAAVATRLIRGARLRDADPQEGRVAQVHLVLTESALRWMPADVPGEPGGILRHTLTVAGLPNFTIQVIPTGTPMRGLPQCAFMLVDWRDPSEAPISIVETPAAELIFTGVDETSDFEAQWDLMLDVALDPAESLAFIARLAEEYPPIPNPGDNP
jgi:transcriptional regulator with XRE-family HTH domain